jgi:hypothetical protein
MVQPKMHHLFRFVKLYRFAVSFLASDTNSDRAHADVSRLLDCAASSSSCRSSLVKRMRKVFSFASFRRFLGLPAMKRL